MAQQFQVQYIDDIDGSDLGGEANTIAFAFDGREYTIDLSDENAEAFREVMAPYIEAGHRVGATARRKPARKGAAKGSGVDTKAVRAWAIENGWNVSERGRIPADVMAAYAEAN